MERPRLRRRAFELLAELEENNTREWFAEHKAALDEEVRSPFAQLLADLSAELSDDEQPLSGGPETMFRMHRDVRFSKDKRPYKTNVSGLLTPEGGKDLSRGMVYLHLDAKGGFAAAGHHQLDAKALLPMRQALVAEPQRFEAALAALEAEGFELDRSDALKSMPRGFAGESDHPLAWAIRLKSLVTQIKLPRKAWLAGEVQAQVLKLARASTQLIALRD